VGWRRRGKDLKHLAWIERRGTVKGRSELEVREVGRARSGDGEAFAAGGMEEGSRSLGTDTTGIVSPVSPMEGSPGLGIAQPAAGERGGGGATI